MQAYEPTSRLCRAAHSIDFAACRHDTDALYYYADYFMIICRKGDYHFAAAYRRISLVAARWRLSLFE